MTTQNESVHTGEFLLSEGNGQISRDVVTIAKDEKLVAGAVVAKLTATGEYVALDTAVLETPDGSETAAGILYAAVDATDAAAKGVVVARLAEVNSAALTGDTDGLAALNIIVR